MINIRKIVLRLYTKLLLSKEKIFKGDKCDLKYLFFKSRKSKYLLIVFSGFNGNGKARYNCIRKFISLRCNKLYILDDFGDDNKGSYYLGENGDFFIDDAVSKLINTITTKNNISKNHIICSGSSKGGFASLYFALKYKFGYAIAGAPQILLGNYLNIPRHEHILKYIFRETSKKEINYGNGLLLGIIESLKVYPKLYLHVGKDDDHYQEHVIPLINKLKSKNIWFDLDVQEGENHGTLGLFYPNFAKKIIIKIISDKTE